MKLDQIMDHLQNESDSAKVKSLGHYGIEAERAFGISLPLLRKIAKEAGKDHRLARDLWNEGHHECKLLATLIGDPKLFNIQEAETWVRDIYSWDVCDQLCINLLVKTPYRWDLPGLWTPEEEEFVRRCGLVMIVSLRIHDKKARDEDFRKFLPLLEKYASDERNFVKKAVNWSIRELGKRSPSLIHELTELCNRLLTMDSKAAKWSARDALREWRKKGLI